MLLCSGFQESCRCQESRCLFQFEQEWAEHWTNFCILEEQALALVQCLGRLAIWWDIFSTIQFTSITSTQQRAHMQVSSSDRERMILFTVSIFARVRSMKSVSLAMLKAEKVGVFQTPQTLCWEEPWLLMLLRDGFQESSRYQESCCGTLNKFCHARRTSTCPIVQCLSNVANW